MLGLGWTTDLDKIRSHLRAELERSASPWGLKVMRNTGKDNDSYPNARPNTSRKGGPTNDLIWEAGSLDWCALNLYLGGDIHQSFQEAKKVIDNWRENLCDQWDYRDLTTGWDGYPWCNSHYSRQLIFWSIPLALAGQKYSAREKKLSFNPRVSAPAKLPFFTPMASGTLELLYDHKYRVTVLSGELQVNEIRVGKTLTTREILLTTGKSLIVEENLH